MKQPSRPEPNPSHAEGRRTACMGAAGGKAKTPAKQASSRANGAKGGRPRKRPATGTTQKDL